jgi:hypothetical protein
LPVTPQDYGAVGDGSTDDTAAFQNALADNRVVRVPGGTYKLSGELTVYENCCLELSQDTVLNFTQTDSNCITLLRLAHLKGNHATIKVPYTFDAIVINCDTREDENRLDPDNLSASNRNIVPPWTHWDPQWKMSRYVTDINICKPTGDDLHGSNDGVCYGTALYIGCHKQKDVVKFMWGVAMSGLRIAGGFTYGIHLYCTPTDNAEYWNNDMRIEAVMYGCETGVLVENTRQARLAVTIQPAASLKTGVGYAKNGVKLVNARNIDLSSARIWDWNEKNSAWSFGSENQHIALYGDCRGLILDDFIQYAQSTYDVRELIYTDTPSNFDTMNILQEPITKFFKPKDGDPYFVHGLVEKKLITEDVMDAHFQTDIVKNFTDVLPTATGTDGEILNGIGYEDGFLVDGGSVSDSIYYISTGFIPWKRGEKLYTHDMFRRTDDTYFRFCLYDTNKNFLLFVPGHSLTEAGWTIGLVDTEDGFVATLNSVVGTENVAYVRFSLYKQNVGELPMVSINNEIKYTYEGFMADGIKVKGDNVLLYSPNGKAYKLNVDDNGAITTTPVN